MLAIDALIERCAPQVSPVLMQALVRTESAFQPLAIGMDGAQEQAKQPASLPEAIATARELAAAGRKFSVGLAQIHVSNVALYSMTWEQAFDACENLAVGQKILWNFYHRALASRYSGVAAIWAALRGYNSGGVDRAVSDAYASRIFAYMTSARPKVQIGSGIPVVRPAAETSTQERPAAEKPTSPLFVSTSTSEGGKPHRPGEPLDIFEKTAAAGF